MSALQDILDKMYVEEELLAQLDEEQKHILFIKMREEQLRRWRIREAELEERERSEPPKQKNGRRIEWLTGSDGEVWVWIMGDHPNDKSIDDIIENETRQKARALAEAELLREKLSESADVSDTDEEQLKQQLRQMRLGTSSEESNDSPSRSSTSKQADQPIDIYNPRSTANFINPIPYYSQVFQPTDKAYEASDGSSFDSNGQNSFDEYDNDINKKPPLIQKLFGKSNNGFKSSPVPWRTPKRAESPVKQVKNTSNGNTSSPGTSTQIAPDRVENNAHLVRTYDQKPTNGTEMPNIERKPNNVIRPPPPVPARPPHLAKKPKDKGFVQAIRSYVPGSNPTTTTYNVQNGPSPFPVVTENNGNQEAVIIRDKLRHNRLGEFVPKDEIEKRQSKMLEMLMDEHHRLKQEADKEAEAERLAYEERERKAREAEAQIKFIAQRAREQHQSGLRTSSALLPVLNSPNSTSFRDAVKSIARPPKPKDRSAIIRWYRQVELPLGTGLDATTKEPAAYFHGILSRQEADALLANQPTGAFLVRVSERIFGYTISYSVGDDSGSSKHFLVEKIPEGYQFLGTNQIVHDSLEALIEYHETRPITSKGREMLLFPIGQTNLNLPDYMELFERTANSNQRHLK